MCQYNGESIKNAIASAMNANGAMNDEVINCIEKKIKDSNIVDVEDIQTVIVKELMNIGYYDAAISFTEYRYEHKSQREVLEDIKFLINYCDSHNAASGSKFDPNANVSHRNLATLMGEIPKKNFININRRLLGDKIKELYGNDIKKEYLKLLTNHFIYKNDETNLANYCASITMYPWLLEGTRSIGGNSKAPGNLKSFAGGFVNMVFIVASMLSGAVATPEFLMYLNYFLQKEYGKEYFKNKDKIVDLSVNERTIGKVITDIFEQVVYSLNQPTGARNFQSVFWNISYYDKYYFDSIFGEFVFPDGSKADWNGVNWLQKYFMEWFNKERTKTQLTYPVETMALLTDGKTPKDEEYANFTSKMYSEGHSFFTYLSPSADSLSSCCRLRNEITDNEFSYTLGAGGVSTGSKSVLTINVNRTIQEAVRKGKDPYESFAEVVDITHKAQVAYNENLKWLQSKGMLPLFDAGYINLKRQYLTIGINGLMEAAEFLGIEISDNDDYQQFVEKILGTVEAANKQYKTAELMFNCEIIPAESVGVKHAKWDKEDGYVVTRDCYNSYFYPVESTELTVLDKINLHGEKYIKHLTGGSALHLNLNEHLDQKQYSILIDYACAKGCNYLTFNIPNTICNECGHINKNYKGSCEKCNSEDVDYITRIIGYLQRVSKFSYQRQIEAKKRHYHKIEETC